MFILSIHDICTIENMRESIFRLVQTENRLQKIGNTGGSVLFCRTEF